jgi:hypothetical protein
MIDITYMLQAQGLVMEHNYLRILYSFLTKMIQKHNVTINF